MTTTRMKARPARKSGSKRKPPVHREGPQQELLFRWLKFTYPDVYNLTFHIPNGGDRHAAVGKKLQREGVKKGVPDIFVALPAGGYSGLFIEFKAAKPHASDVSEEQKAWLEKLEAAGYKALVCKGTQEAKEAIFNYVIADEVPY